MKSACLLSVYLLGSIIVAAQGKYGFGMVVVSNEGVALKQIFVTRVISIDSVCLGETKKKYRRQNQMYFDCVGDWAIEIIKRAHPKAIGPVAEIQNLSVVEEVPDFPEVEEKRINEAHIEMNDNKESVYMQRMMADRFRAQMLDIAYRDPKGKVVTLD